MGQHETESDGRALTSATKMAEAATKMAEDRIWSQRLWDQIQDDWRPKVDVTRADPDLAKGHPLLRDRWNQLEAFLRAEYDMVCRPIEVYRSESRQRWLYGAGRRADELIKHALPPDLSRPYERRVTNAWSATVSAHGWKENGSPAAAAIDVSPVGPDGRPFTADDRWDEFVRVLAIHGPGIGLTHFTSHGKVTDQPHLEMVEWSNKEHRLILV